MTKTAVVLFNLGGPDTRESIRPFLKNFFMDPNIIQVPRPFRDLISSLIANRRSGKEAGSAYAELGYCSPLLANTKEQATALENTLKNTQPDQDWKIFIAMRYWHPMSDETARAVKEWAPDRIVLLPLYPQFSTTTSGSSLQEWNRAAKQAQLETPAAMLCCYSQDPGFIEASARLIREKFDQYVTENPDQPVRVLFSAHGLPEKIITQGDPYQWQCEESAKAIAVATGIPNLDWQICYQSRVGPLKWIGPSTNEALEKAANDKVAVMVYPHAFVSEHVETLVEIDMEYRHMASELGIPGFVKVPTVGVAPEFINGLARMVIDNQNRSDIVGPVMGSCPNRFGRCCRAGPKRV